MRKVDSLWLITAPAAHLESFLTWYDHFLMRLGGDKASYDVLNSYLRNVVDGNEKAWVGALDIARNASDDEILEALTPYVDMENLIDYMLLNFYGGNQDWDHHNWYAARERRDGAGFKFFSWDAERTLEDERGDDRTNQWSPQAPSFLVRNLIRNEDFLKKVHQRVRKHFFNNGVLTPEKARERYAALASHIEEAVVAESARWGNAQQARPYSRDNHWIPERDRLLKNYFPERTRIVLSQLIQAGLFIGNP